MHVLGLKNKFKWLVYKNGFAGPCAWRDITYRPQKVGIYNLVCMNGN